MKKKKQTLTRRRFLAVGSVSFAGVWTACSNQLCIKTFKGLVAEASTRIEIPDAKPDPGSWNPNTITAAWLGHSSVLLNFYGTHILTDPVLTRRIGAHTSVGTLGPRRIVAPALSPSQLPRIDLVLLSHAHMDHLNPATLRQLKGNPSVVTAHATTDLLQFRGLGNITSLAWNAKVRLKVPEGDLAVRAFEVRHWGARWRYDDFRGYNGYTIEREGKRIIFGGDTAYTDSFSSLRGDGPYDLAIMPIGAYDPHIISHCSPEEAVSMTNSAGADYLLPVHFKTFRLGREGAKEPLRRLSQSIESDRIGWSDIGQTFRLGQTSTLRIT